MRFTMKNVCCRQRKKKAERSECIGVDKVRGVRLNTWQCYQNAAYTQALSSNKFFFISFVIYLWLIMQHWQRQEGPQSQIPSSTIYWMFDGRRGDRRVHTNAHRWCCRKTGGKCDNIYIKRAGSNPNSRRQPTNRNLNKYCDDKWWWKAHKCLTS